MNNELSNLASSLKNIDYKDVIKGVLYDKRWSPIINQNRVVPSISSYFTPGAGFGGSCFPKDVHAIKTQGSDLGLNMSMTNAILTVNEKQPYQVLNTLKNKFNTLDNKKVLLLGLSFKENTDDIRESSSLKILSNLLTNNVDVIAHDPIAMDNTKKYYKNIQYTDNWENEISNVDIIIIGTNWKEYLNLKNHLTLIAKNNIVVFDTKRLFVLSDMIGIDYMTFGYVKL
jgi:UDPglucose 6-dehydrogenase/GDP-mannose 6-dehydrogenase